MNKFKYSILFAAVSIAQAGINQGANLGNEAYAVGSNSAALGHHALAIADESVAIGDHANAISRGGSNW